MTKLRSIPASLPWLLLYGLISCSTACCAAEVLVLSADGSQGREESQIREAAEFYGLTFRRLHVTSAISAHEVLTQVRRPEVVGVLASAEALHNLGARAFSSLDSARRDAGIPMLVFAVAASTEPTDLSLWSAGAIKSCEASSDSRRPTTLAVSVAPPVSRTLGGFELPAVTSPACRLAATAVPGFENVLTARGENLSNPVLVRVPANGAEVFITPHTDPFDLSWAGQPTALDKAFSSIAPFMLFLAYAGADYTWRLDGRYANLTIDDPWLTQPYGHVDYEALLAEMKRHNFHTTIAFIPWNFDRSERSVVRIIRANPDRFSLSVHGNDHAHREFGPYVDSPLAEQIRAIRQAVARMERFHALTDIDYDRVMVFPHGVAPTNTFSALKRYGFLGTVNFVNVPLDATMPTAPTYLLRPFTVQFANLLSLSRLSALGPIPRLHIAILAFFGNPILFYGHEDLFEGGITAFNEIVDLVNRLQPDTRWTGLGEIARHSHLIRKRHDRAWDVRMLSDEMDLRNPTDHEELFYIERRDDPSNRPSSLAVDGVVSPNDAAQTQPALRLSIPGGQVRKVRVAYPNDLTPARENIAKTNFRAAAIRRMADARDLYLSHSLLGRTVRRVYYRTGVNTVQLYIERNWPIFTASTALLFIAFCYRYQRRKRLQRKEALPLARK